MRLYCRSAVAVAVVTVLKEGCSVSGLQLYSVQAFLDYVNMHAATQCAVPDPEILP